MSGKHEFNDKYLQEQDDSFFDTPVGGVSEVLKQSSSPSETGIAHGWYRGNKEKVMDVDAVVDLNLQVSNAEHNTGETNTTDKGCVVMSDTIQSTLIDPDGNDTKTCSLIPEPSDSYSPVKEDKADGETQEPFNVDCMQSRSSNDNETAINRNEIKAIKVHSAPFEKSESKVDTVEKMFLTDCDQNQVEISQDETVSPTKRLPTNAPHKNTAKVSSRSPIHNEFATLLEQVSPNGSNASLILEKHGCGRSSVNMFPNQQEANKPDTDNTADKTISIKVKDQCGENACERADQQMDDNDNGLNAIVHATNIERSTVHNQNIETENQAVAQYSPISEQRKTERKLSSSDVVSSSNRHYSEIVPEHVNNDTNKDKNQKIRFDLVSSDKMFDTYFTGRLPTLGPAEMGTPGANIQTEKTDTEVKIDGNVSENSIRNTRQVSTSIPSERESHINQDLQQRHINGISRTPTKTRKIKQNGQTKKTIKTDNSDTNCSLETPFHVIEQNVDKMEERPEQVHSSDKYVQDQSRLENSGLTLRDLNAQSTKLISTAYEENAIKRCHSLPHVQTISKYTKDLSSSSHNQSDIVNHDDNKMVSSGETSPITTLKSNDIDEEHYDASGDDDNGLDDDNQTISTVYRANAENHKHDNQQTKESNNNFFSPIRASSGNDLNELIEAAKYVYKDTYSTITPYSTNGHRPSLDVDQSTVDGGQDGQHSSTHSHRTQRKEETFDTSISAITPKSSNNELICSRCMQIDTDINKAGYCKQCKDYLCHRCIRRHKRLNESNTHEITNSFCANELKNNRFVNSIGFCTSCHKFLCMKCIMNHFGFQEYRHHKIVQAPVIMKTIAERNVKQLKEDGIYRADELSDGSFRKSKKMTRNVLPAINQNNPYRLNYAGVPSSIYPSPYKDLPFSFTSKPKWAFSSVPKLPYLMQRKSDNMPSHFKNTTKMRFSKQKTGKDKKSEKMISLEKKYAEGEASITPRRVEYNSFTARSLNGGLSHVTPAGGISSRTDSIKAKERQTKRAQCLKNAKYISEYCLSIPFPSEELQCDILGMAVLANGKLVVADKRNNNIKLYNGRYECRALLQFTNRLVDVSASNLCPSDVYAATPKYIYEISALKGLQLQRKIKVEVKRIEGFVCWKYGLAVVVKKTSVTWELRLLDYRGNVKSKLEIVNPFSHVIETKSLYHLTTTKGGKCVVLTDTKNSCVIGVDVLTRCVVFETVLDDPADPSYLTSDGDHNVFVSNPTKVCQLTKVGSYKGTVVHKGVSDPRFGCITYNKRTDRLYVQTGPDIINVYQLL